MEKMTLKRVLYFRINLRTILLSKITFRNVQHATACLENSVKI